MQPDTFVRIKNATPLVGVKRLGAKMGFSGKKSASQEENTNGISPFKMIAYARK